jgi:hypothetical protein
VVWIRRLTAAAFLLAVALVPAAPASAAFFEDWFSYHDCPKPSYSPLRYWAPEVLIVPDCIHGSHLSVYAPNRHPEIPASTINLRFRCPPAAPPETFVPVTTPPETSRFKY